MRFKLTPRSMLFAVLCFCLTNEELWLRNALASNTDRIAFTFSGPGSAEIYVMDSDGENQENLTNHPAYDGIPDWSPDGTKIAFVSTRGKVAAQIYVMDADGKNPIRLTDGARHKSDPEWSPDGQQIAFTVHPSFPGELLPHIDVMDADGMNRERLEDFAEDPSWSPDGREIAFASRRADGERHDIYVIGADGQGLRRVTHELWGGFRPAFSPDGKRIAYMASDESFFHIFVVGIDGENRVRLTHQQQNHGDPAWSVSGRRIAYAVWDNDGPSTIHMMTADGKYLKQLRDDHGGSDSKPDIRSVGLAVSPTFNKTTIWGRLKKLSPALQLSVR